MKFFFPGKYMISLQMPLSRKSTNGKDQITNTIKIFSSYGSEVVNKNLLSHYPAIDGKDFWPKR
ncbi:hypothetical protein PGS1_07240 [Enterobacter cloacae subsp. cloacae GS1]|nr:hypothetical protein PGS1_07240 [Enterobacter cloacae subsp. cloacae GS1]